MKNLDEILGMDEEDKVAVLESNGFFIGSNASKTLIDLTFEQALRSETIDVEEVFMK